MRALLAAALTLILAATVGCTPPPDDDAGKTAAPAKTSTGCEQRADAPKRQFRGMWTTTVRNVDWPSKPGLSVDEQRAELVALLDLAKARRLNAVFLQIRPNGDTFWPSKLEPWSHWLSGTQGKDPGYDPLAFAVREAHERNIELHAWFNPYRASYESGLADLVAEHPARKHPGWLFKYGKDLYYDPGEPRAREFVERLVLEVVRNYDIDGVHFDDYFYPYPLPGKKLRDKSTFDRHGNGFTRIEDWRRHNVNTLVRELDEKIHRAKPQMKFGISPSGIWRNVASDPRGSPTKGLESYSAIYADTRTWVKEGWVDYVVPQLYWRIGFDMADYAKLVPWWAELVRGTDVHLYIGQAAYRLGTEKGWKSRDVLSRHLTLNRRYPTVRGDVFFNASSVRADPRGGVSQIVADHYRRVALVPPMRHLDDSTPKPATVTSASHGASAVTVRWRAGTEPTPTSFAVYRFAGKSAPDCGFADATHLVATTRRTQGPTQTYVDRSAADGATYTYYVTALDRLGNESRPGPGRTSS